MYSVIRSKCQEQRARPKILCNHKQMPANEGSDSQEDLPRMAAKKKQNIGKFHGTQVHNDHPQKRPQAPNKCKFTNTDFARSGEYLRPPATRSKVEKLDVQNFGSLVKIAHHHWALRKFPVTG